MSEIYYLCRGQDDNIGDVVLRRVLARWSAECGRIHVFMGAASETFVASTLASVGGDVKVYTSKRKWMIGLFRDTLRGRGVLVFNPGEQRLEMRTAFSLVPLLTIQALARLKGGRPALRVGVCLKRTVGLGSRLSETLVRQSVRMSAVNAWRDTETTVRFPGRPSCDLAFAEGLQEREVSIARKRQILAVSLRPDRPLDLAFAADVISSFAHAHQLVVVFVVQVRRDADLARRMSKLVPESRVLDWPRQVGHGEQEAAVRALYRESRYVVSDRIHALIVAVTEGSIPIGFASASDSKTRTHLSAAGMLHPEWSREEANAEDLTEFAAFASETPAWGDPLRAARAELAVVHEKFVEAARG
ncbi:hypothetical protein [Nocardioides sp.]|uniref:hypothetical protein n=1 Tax=Nocardioides sp. TaxID=35761 RepID=UPI00263764EA|nr:hypothetical protein [Nocardioides sp.]